MKFMITGNEPTAISLADGCGNPHSVVDGVADLCDSCSAAAAVGGFQKAEDGAEKASEPKSTAADRLAAARAAKAAKKAASEQKAEDGAEKA